MHLHPTNADNLEFEGFLRCGILACGFGRVCCPTCGARRMSEAAASLVDEVIPLVPVRQLVVTLLQPLRLWLARSTALATTVCSKVSAALTKHLQRESDTADGLAGFVVFMQRFGSAGNLNVHLHIIALDGSRRTKGGKALFASRSSPATASDFFQGKSTGRLKFIPASAPTEASTTRLVTDFAHRINTHLCKKGYLEEVDGMPVLGNTEEIFEAEYDELHLPAQAVSVAAMVCAARV